MDYSRVYSDAKPKCYFGNITDYGFWYKHDGDQAVYNDLTPYIVIVLKIEGGDYDGGELVAIQWNTWDQGYATEWTLFDNDSWHYIVYDKDDKYVGQGGMPIGVTLAEIQAQYNGVIDRVAIAIGLAGGDEPARVLVDDLYVNVTK